MSASTKTLPEIRELDAPLEIAEIYRDFRVSSGNPQVNLIFRHLATIPGFLVWAWDVLRPLYRSEYLAQAIARVIDAVDSDGRGFVAEGLPSVDAEAIRNLLTAYNFGNAQNVIALKSLVVAMHREMPLRAISAIPPHPVAPIAASVPQLPLLADLDDEQATLVKKISSVHGSANAGVVPSMYLHLALWPSALRNATDRVVMLMTSSDGKRKLRIIDEITSAEASVLAVRLSTSLARLPKDVERKATAAIEVFIKVIIPEMMLVGCTLLGGSPAQGATARNA